MKGMLAPKYRDVDLGRAEVRQVYKISSVGTIAGLLCTWTASSPGTPRSACVRDGIVVAEDKMSSLQALQGRCQGSGQGL